MLLLVDNYDSFTYNLYQYLCELGQDVMTVRNDKITVDEVEAAAPRHIVISPGPGTPDDAGVSKRLIEVFAGRIPILGVCLGHQCIGEVFGGRITNAPTLVHGKVSSIEHDGKGLFAGLPSPFGATRYHSLVVDAATVPDCLEVTARTADGLVMGLRHKEFAIEGVQFHPESIMTEFGHDLLRNFLNTTQPRRQARMTLKGAAK